MVIALILFLTAMWLCVTENRTIYETVAQSQRLWEDEILFEQEEEGTTWKVLDAISQL